MSIADSQADRAQAEADLANRSEDQLRDDLVYWILASHDHRQETIDLQTRQQTVRELWQESATWELLIADELAKRRVRRNT